MTSDKVPPQVIQFQFPPVPADIASCFKGVVDVPDRELSVSEVETLWKQDRIRVRLNQQCGNRFLAWYNDISSNRGGADVRQKHGG